jgi:hypothetical protein
MVLLVFFPELQKVFSCGVRTEPARGKRKEVRVMKLGDGPWLFSLVVEIFG